jgi:hypothetical protein
MKRWFVYPPGYNLPKEIELQFSSTISAWQWFTHVYPELKKLPKPNKEKNKKTMMNEDYESGFRPLECVQLPGDVLYLPTLWNHMTVNIGETIGIGGQEGLSSEER